MENQLKAFVDRIEDDIVVLVIEQTPVDLPRTSLPPDLKPGDHLSVMFQLDPAAKQECLQQIEALQQELTAGADPEQLHFKL